jgi:hypothetical protein
MAYKVFQHDPKWQPRKGLEGPFHYPNGQVLYYDPIEGQYYDPTTDMYVCNEEANIILNQLFDILRK